MFSVLALLEANRIGVFLVPPFGATLTILMLLPDAPVVQPHALIAGSVTKQFSRKTLVATLECQEISTVSHGLTTL
jgi:CBS-domain-containing membrane protein